MLFWGESNGLNCMESSFFELLDISGIDSFFFESLDWSWAIDFEFLGLLFFFGFGFSWLFGLFTHSLLVFVLIMVKNLGSLKSRLK
jgi:hypothetical protein